MEVLKSEKGDWFLPKFEIYISCPYHLLHYPIDENIKEMSVRLEDAGFIVYAPTPIVSRGLIQETEYRRHFIIYADAVLRMGGDSEEADREVKAAEKYGIPTFDNVQELLDFFRKDEASSEKVEKFMDRLTKSKQQRQREQLNLFGDV